MQHALRAFTPRDQKAVKAAAETFRAKPGLDVAVAITELGVAEALVFMLGEGSVSSPVERARVIPPRSRHGTVTMPWKNATPFMQRSPLKSRYDAVLNDESAHEKLMARRKEKAANADAEIQAKATTKSAVRAASPEVGRNIGRQLLRGLPGSLQKSMH